MSANRRWYDGFAHSPRSAGVVGALMFFLFSLASAPQWSFGHRFFVAAVTGACLWTYFRFFSKKYVDGAQPEHH